MTLLVCFRSLLHVDLLTLLQVTLPLWKSSPMEIGTVGYRSKTDGRFVTLFNSFDPATAPCPRTKTLESVDSFGRVHISRATVGQKKEPYQKEPLI